MPIAKIDKVVTFCCSDKIHVYRADSSVYPAYPYRAHKSIKSAKESLKNRGIKKPKVIEVA